MHQKVLQNKHHTIHDSCPWGQELGNSNMRANFTFGFLFFYKKFYKVLLFVMISKANNKKGQKCV